MTAPNCRASTAATSAVSPAPAGRGRQTRERRPGLDHAVEVELLPGRGQCVEGGERRVTDRGSAWFHEFVR